MLSRGSSQLLRPNCTSIASKSLALSPKTCFQNRQISRTMAAAAKVTIPPDFDGHFHTRKPVEGSPKKLSELLQQNHEKHHMYFNEEGFHNHIAHHLLAIYALGASPGDLDFGYKTNESYQRPLVLTGHRLPAEGVDSKTYEKYLGNESLFADFLTYFTNELSSKGMEAVISEYLLKGDARADDMLVRLFSGFLHPIIHLGYAVEYNQPAIAAEALAQAATHNNWIGTLFYQAEAAAKQAGSSTGSGGRKKTLVELSKEARANDKLRFSAKPEDANKIRDGIMKRAPDELIALAKEWTVGGADEIEAKTAELVNFCAFMTLGAQKPPKAVKMDFFYMHAINACPMMVAWVKQPWVTTAQKRRILEWAGREVLALYVSRGSPELLYGEIEGYKPMKSGESSWEGIYDRVNPFEDDGHTSKFIRALAFGEQLCKKYEAEPWCVIKGRDWNLAANMVMDSVQGTVMPAAEQRQANGGSNQTLPTSKWIRNAGMDEAWDNVPDRMRWVI